MKERIDRFVIIGFVSSLLLTFFYFLVSSALGGFDFAVSNFIALWYWMVPLITGFGVQMGLFFYVKEKTHKAGMHAAVSSGVSTTAMVACCAHHLADVAPFLGISVLGLFLTKYQTVFLLTGIFSNILGILNLARLIKTGVEKEEITKAIYAIGALAIAAVIISALIISQSEETKSAEKQFSAQVSEKNDVEFEVRPLNPSQFEIDINTHSVDLAFRLEDISVLYDDLGSTYKPLQWEGSPPGGHHRSGTLTFSQVNKNAKSIKLVIDDGAEREFDWQIN